MRNYALDGRRSIESSKGKFTTVVTHVARATYANYKI
jgi:hypothetical protein